MIAASKLAARRVYADMEIDLASDVTVGRNVRVVVERGTRNRFVMGPGGRIGDDVRILLAGGDVAMGPRCELRRGVTLNIGGGRLVMHGDNPISWNSVIHCSNLIDLDHMVGIAEHVTVADSSHFWTTPDEHFWHNVRVGEVHVGHNTWICPKVTIGRDVRIGAHCLIASGSVVVGTVPDNSFASGVPARVRPMPLPWTDRP